MPSLSKSAMTLALALAAPAVLAAPPAYDSAFAGYRAYQEPKVAPWKQTNELIARTSGHGAHGGHGAHAAQPAAPAPAQAPKPAAAAPAAKPDPHAGHNH